MPSHRVRRAVFLKADANNDNGYLVFPDELHNPVDIHLTRLVVDDTQRPGKSGFQAAGCQANSFFTQVKAKIIFHGVTTLIRDSIQGRNGSHDGQVSISVGLSVNTCPRMANCAYSRLTPVMDFRI